MTSLCDRTVCRPDIESASGGAERIHGKESESRGGRNDSVRIAIEGTQAWFDREAACVKLRTRLGDHTNPKRKRGSELPSGTRASLPHVTPSVELCPDSWLGGSYVVGSLYGARSSEIGNTEAVPVIASDWHF